MIGHNTVQPKIIESIGNCMLHNTLHISLSLVARGNRIAQMAGLKNTSDDIAQRTTSYDMSQFSIGADKVYRLPLANSRSVLEPASPAINWW